jgi:hypothetical protein
MSFLQSVVSVPMVWLIAAAAVAATLLVLWLSTLMSRRWYVTLRRSEETELIGFHLRRIADAVEQISAKQEQQRPLDTAAPKSVAMSMFGR